MNLKKITDRAKDAVEKRGGTDALKEDAQELKKIATGKGSLKEKAKAAADAVKDPGRRGADEEAEAPSTKPGIAPNTPEAPTAGAAKPKQAK